MIFASGVFKAGLESPEISIARHRGWGPLFVPSPPAGSYLSVFPTPCACVAACTHSCTRTHTQPCWPGLQLRAWPALPGTLRHGGSPPPPVVQILALLERPFQCRSGNGQAILMGRELRYVQFLCTFPGSFFQSSFLVSGLNGNCTHSLSSLPSPCSHSGHPPPGVGAGRGRWKVCRLRNPFPQQSPAVILLLALEQ